MANTTLIFGRCAEKIGQLKLGDRLLPVWHSLKMRELSHPFGDGAEIDRTGAPVVNVYSNLTAGGDPVKLMLEQFGLYVASSAKRPSKVIWSQKLDVPTEKQIEEAESKLADPVLRKTARTYKDILDTYTGPGCAVSKLVFINISNALLANNIAFSSSVGVNLKKWGPTAQYCNLNRYHSLLPIVSAYAPAAIFNRFECAFASLILDDLAQVRETSVREGLRRVITRIVENLPKK